MPRLSGMVHITSIEDLHGDMAGASQDAMISVLGRRRIPPTCQRSQ